MDDALGELDAYTDGQAEGEHYERDRIVAWLNSDDAYRTIQVGDTAHAIGPGYGTTIRLLAEAIERGEHVPAPPAQSDGSSDAG